MSAAALTDPSEAVVEVQSDLFGSIAVPGKRIFDFTAGLVGFPDCRRFALLPGKPGVYWLQSLELAALTFLLADPFIWVDGFELDLDIPPVGDRPSIESEVAVLCIVTLPRSGDAPATINLQGPLVLYFADRAGRQLVLPQSSWGVRHPVDLSRDKG